MADISTPVSFKEFAEGFVKLFESLGWIKALTACFFFFLFGVTAYLFRIVIKGKDEEIKRLREENDKYRTIYLQNLDASRGISPPSSQRSSTKKNRP